MFTLQTPLNSRRTLAASRALPVRVQKTRSWSLRSGGEPFRGLPLLMGPERIGRRRGEAERPSRLFRLRIPVSPDRTPHGRAGRHGRLAIRIAEVNMLPAQRLGLLGADAGRRAESVAGPVRVRVRARRSHDTWFCASLADDSGRLSLSSPPCARGWSGSLPVRIRAARSGLSDAESRAWWFPPCLVVMRLVRVVAPGSAGRQLLLQC